MSNVMDRLNQRAAERGVPLSAHIDLTWACNEHCIHCYLDHDDHTQLSLEELQGLMDQMADAGVFFLTFSGGEIFLRKDLREIVRHARMRGFDIRLKTNAVLIGAREIAWIRELGIHRIQVSIYSHRPAVHDGITKVRGSLERSLRAIRLLNENGVRITIACVLMRQNAGEYAGVQALARELGAEFTVDPTITPHINGDRSILDLNIGREELAEVFRQESLVGNVPAFLAPPPPVDEEMLDGTPCSAGHSAFYISPKGDLYPCVQFPIHCGNVKDTAFMDIWRKSPQLQEVRAIRTRDLPTCSACGHAGTCTRCPGLAYMEGSMYGPSAADCEKSYVRTGIPSENMNRLGTVNVSARLVQIAAAPCLPPH